MEFSLFTRKLTLQRMQERKHDLLIIGGGITGAGLALQAAASGMDTVLLEMQDFGEGTSSRSTKLVHGGIRYLKHFDVEVVSDTVKERAVVQNIAPHIPRPVKMLLPIYDENGSTFNLFRLKVAMDLYDLLAGVSDEKLKNRMLSKEEVLALAPNLASEKLIGGGLYLDFRNNDARLVIDNVKKAVSDGALIASRIKVIDFIKNENNKIIGVKAHDLIEDEIIEIHARVIVNCSGHFSDEVRKLAEPNLDKRQIRPTKGVHLVVDKAKLEVSQPIYFDSGLNDGRMIFVLPRENKTYLGTTDTDYNGDLVNPKVSAEDVNYLLEIVNKRFPNANLCLNDIESSWAGLRPLLSSNSASDYNGGNNGKISDDDFTNLIDIVSAYLKKENSREDVEKALRKLESSNSEKNLKPSDVSRGSSLTIDKTGLVNLAGGKITDYRKMAKGALDLCIKILNEKYNRTFKAINSKTYPISGGDLNPNNVDEELMELAKYGVKKGLEYEDALYLANLYGSNATKVYNLNHHLVANSNLNRRDLLSLHYSLREEMCLSACDYLLRRTNYMLFMRKELDLIKDDVIKEMAAYYNWKEDRIKEEKEVLAELLKINDLEYLKGR